jgi:hypothetical protein
MPGLTYQTYVEQIALMAVVEPITDPNFVTLIPSMIEYAELRIYRELDLLQASASLHGSAYFLIAGNRNIVFPQNLPDGSSFVVSEQINLILPAGTSDPDLGERVPLTPTTKEFLDIVYGSSLVANRAQPQYFSPFNESFFLVGPVPDQNYFVEVVGTLRPAPISSLNPVTFISQYLPDMFIMASMIYISAYQRNFGRQSDDPQMAQSYESQYQALKVAALEEEARKKFEGSGWSSQITPTVASPSRG